MNHSFTSHKDSVAACFVAKSPGKLFFEPEKASALEKSADRESNNNMVSKIHFTVLCLILILGFR